MACRAECIQNAQCGALLQLSTLTLFGTVHVCSQSQMIEVATRDTILSERARASGTCPLGKLARHSILPVDGSCRIDSSFALQSSCRRDVFCVAARAGTFSLLRRLPSRLRLKKRRRPYSCARTPRRAFMSAFVPSQDPCEAAYCSFFCSTQQACFSLVRVPAAVATTSAPPCSPEELRDSAWLQACARRSGQPC